MYHAGAIFLQHKSPCPPLLYPFGKEPNQKKYLSTTVQSLEWYATQSFNNMGLVGRVDFDVTPCDM